MPGPIPEITNEAVLKLRLPHELKRRLKNVALKRRKSDLSELLREVLWQLVETDDPVKRQRELELLPAEGDKS